MVRFGNDLSAYAVGMVAVDVLFGAIVGAIGAAAVARWSPSRRPSYFGRVPYGDGNGIFKFLASRIRNLISCMPARPKLTEGSSSIESK